MKLCISKKTSGFSLIELMIVVAIIGILASIAIPSYQSYIAKSKMAHLYSFADDVKLKLTEYHASNGTFPSSLTDVKGLIAIPANSYIMGGGSVSAISNALTSGMGFIVNTGSTTGIKFTIVGQNVNPGNDPVLQYTAVYTPATGTTPARTDWTCSGAATSTYGGTTGSLPTGYLPSTCTSVSSLTIP